MALGESRTSLTEIIERELTRPGDGAFEAAQARRIAEAVAQAIEDNNNLIEMKLTQKLQTGGLHV
jgi:hypothetical protein